MIAPGGHGGRLYDRTTPTHDLESSTGCHRGARFCTKQEVAALMPLLAERPDWIGIHFDKVFSRPITGDAATDRMSTQPSALLVASINGLKPGTALDGGMGLGRNAVYLAQQGWTVTGFDISEQALALSRANAEKAGVCVNAVNASYDSFDFGSNRWDLIALAFAWAPVTDPAFVERLRTSLRSGGRIVFEHTIQNSPGPRVTKALMPNELRGCFSTFTIASYEETVDLGDWGGPGTSLVRMVEDPFSWIRRSVLHRRPFSVRSR